MLPLRRTPAPLRVRAVSRIVSTPIGPEFVHRDHRAEIPA